MRRIALLIALAPGLAYADDTATAPADPPPRTFADALGTTSGGDLDYGISFPGERSDDDYLADPVVVRTPWMTFGQLGFVFAQRDIGGSATTHAGVLLGAGILRGKYRLGGELHVGYDRTNEEPVQSGFSGEASFHLRRDAIHWSGKSDDVGGSFNTWIDAGAGAEVLWFGGDRVVRPEASLGIGLGMEVFKPDRSGRFAGLSVEFRVVAAPAIEWTDLAERCTGTCSMRLAKPDFSGLVVIALPFSP